MINLDGCLKLFDVFLSLTNVSFSTVSMHSCFGVLVVHITLSHDDYITVITIIFMYHPECSVLAKFPPGLSDSHSGLLGG